MRLANYNDSALFFGEFEKKVKELKSADAKVSEKKKLNYMLNTLPETYSYIGDLIDTLKEADQTADYIRNQIKLAEMNNQGEYGEKSTNAFTAKKKEGCFKCGKFGHFVRACQDGGQAGQQSGTWRGPTRGRGRGRGGRSNYSRGRSNFRQHGEEQSGKDASAWIATAHAAHSSEGNSLRNCDIEWLLDSGCTDHLINNDEYFEISIDLKENVNIYLGDNRFIKATKIGTV